MLTLNSLAPGRSEWNFKCVVFKPILVIDGYSTVLVLWNCPQMNGYISLDLTDKSILVWVMTWCGRTTSHYLSQCWLSSVMIALFLDEYFLILKGFPNTNTNIFSCDQAALRTPLSVCPSVTSFSLCSWHRIATKFSGVITNDKSDIHAKVQGHRSNFKVTRL